MFNVKGVRLNTGTECNGRHWNVVSRMKSPLFNPDGMSKMSICIKIQNSLFFYILTPEITLSHLAIPMEPLVFSALGHTIKCVTRSKKRSKETSLQEMVQCPVFWFLKPYL